jgi:hypothetical protein
VVSDYAAEHLPPLNWQVERSSSPAVPIGWSLLAGLVGPMPVVMTGVLAEDRPQSPFVVDQHPVGALGSHGTCPSFGVAVLACGVCGGILTSCTSHMEMSRRGPQTTRAICARPHAHSARISAALSWRSPLNTWRLCPSERWPSVTAAIATWERPPRQQKPRSTPSPRRFAIWH